ncbi:hypothetical protein HF521_020056 [Silurus meridionalis]|uniref:Uncharacterized protein n=1 Tax=Silurus meridionalis TaxID=175797 RepID=A0A8T0BHT9_SILME|nr:hypothetical protein HF521_020056 [Silurus meridionalis]
MFSSSSSLLLVILILQSHTLSNTEVLMRFCLSDETRSQTTEATTCAPQQEHTQEPQHAETSQGNSRPNPEGCCVHFSFTLPSDRPSATHKEHGVNCPEHVSMVKTTTSLCEEHSNEWVQNVFKSYDWCLVKGYAPKQGVGEIPHMSFNRFIVAKTKEDCCYLFSQTPAEILTGQKEEMGPVCKQISFNVTLQTTTGDCTGRRVSLVREFIRMTYNCLRWGF